MKRSAPLKRTKPLPRTPLRRGKPKPRSRPTGEQIIANRRADCWLAQFSDRPCAGPMQLCHLIDKQRLRQRHVPESAIWDQRILVDGCERHHGIVPKSAIPRSELPSGIEDYAAEHGLEGSLLRDYGELVA